eukprot:3427089-Pyramimonas_sp.AAC.1
MVIAMQIAVVAVGACGTSRSLRFRESFNSNVFAIRKVVVVVKAVAVVAVVVAALVLVGERIRPVKAKTASGVQTI